MSHPKGVLLERAQKLGLPRPEFRTAQTGPEHEPSFISDVVLEGEVIGTGQGSTKRTAEKHAAEEALIALEARQEGGKAPAKGKQAGKAAGKGATAKGGKADAGKSDAGKAAKAAAAKGGEAPESKGAAAGTKTAAKASAAPAAKAAPAAERAAVAAQPAAEDEADDEGFDGPWPMFDDLLAAAVTVAERRVFADLRGEEARVAIRDFSLALYKELLLGLGDIVEEDEEEDEEED